MKKATKFFPARLLLLFVVAALSVSCQDSQDSLGTDDNNGGGNKPKILALHGGGGDGASFSQQQGIRDLVAALPQYEFVFANAPEEGGLWLLDPPSKEKPTTDPNWANRSIEYLDRFVDEHGPFYGMIAYSQGTSMALIYLAHAPANTFDKVALFNGYALTTHQGLLATIDRAAQFAVSTLVFSGATDWFVSLSPGLAARFESPLEIQSPTASHHLPYSDDVTFSQVVSFLAE